MNPDYSIGNMSKMSKIGRIIEIESYTY